MCGVCDVLLKKAYHRRNLGSWTGRGVATRQCRDSGTRHPSHWARLQPQQEGVRVWAVPARSNAACFEQSQRTRLRLTRRALSQSSSTVPSEIRVEVVGKPPPRPSASVHAASSLSRLRLLPVVGASRSSIQHRDRKVGDLVVLRNVCCPFGRHRFDPPRISFRAELPWVPH